MNDLGTGAVFSPCRRYRYHLWRRWDIQKPMIAFCMLNPSTADERENDPTVERCQRRAKMWDFGGVEVLNIFAYRSTDPRALVIVNDPFGPENLGTILRVASRVAMVVCAWGKHGHLRGAGQRTADLLRGEFPHKTHYLKLNGDGTPAHPLYLPYTLNPTKWSAT